MNGKGIQWRMTRGLYYPDGHIQFVLDRPFWPDPPVPELPTTSKAAFELAEELRCKLPEMVKELTIEAQEKKHLEDSGEGYVEAAAAARDAINKVILCSKGNPQALPFLGYIIEYGLAQLRNLAELRETEECATRLTLVLAEAVQNLQRLAIKSPEPFRKAARALPSFPMLVSKHKAQQTENTNLLKTLEVGAGYWWQQDRKERASSMPSKTGRAKEIVKQLVAYLQKYQITFHAIANHATDLPAWTKCLPNLAPLTAKSWRPWFDVAWLVVLEATEGKPARFKEYLQIARRTQRENDYGDAVEVTHSAIKDALRDAFQELATGRSARRGKSAGIVQARERPD